MKSTKQFPVSNRVLVPEGEKYFQPKKWRRNSKPLDSRLACWDSKRRTVILWGSQSAGRHSQALNEIIVKRKWLRNCFRFLFNQHEPRHSLLSWLIESRGNLFFTLKISARIDFPSSFVVSTRSLTSFLLLAMPIPLLPSTSMQGLKSLRYFCHAHELFVFCSLF